MKICLKIYQLNIKITNKSKKARERYQSVSKKEKEKKQQYVHGRY